MFAWNKLFDREFFIREVGGFPVGVRYEDQEATAKAYLRGTFDVLNVNVYLWRRRIEGTSITQQKTDPVDLADRLEVKGAVSRLMAAEASEPGLRVVDGEGLGFDLRPYLEQVPRTGEEFCCVFERVSWASCRSPPTTSGARSPSSIAIPRCACAMITATTRQVPDPT